MASIVPSSVPNPDLLQAMQLVAKMKEAADKNGIGFVGGFITPSGEKFTMTNLSDEETKLMLPEDLK